ncbi:MAG TPA: DUF6688 family protein [Clostridia bacterium]|nr:DUF6688 family protein [Clostridia bacterium]
MEIFLYIFLILLLLVPVLLTLTNIINLFKKNKFIENLADSLTFILGIILTYLLYRIWEPLDYTKPIILDGGMSLQFHAPVSSHHIVTILVLSAISIIGYMVLRIGKTGLTPLISVFCFSSIFIGIILNAVFIIQLSKNAFPNNVNEHIPFDVFYMMLYPLNYILCSTRLMRQSISLHMGKQTVEGIVYKNKILKVCQQILLKSSGWYIAAFILMFPLLILLIIILVLFGQMPDAAIRAFTETSDWALSQKISPPPIQYEGHYLCTVALNGHRNIVKPVRMGMRHGVKILVNRQLCIANAFEQLIQEKMPKIHRFVRYIYDKYGYPLSKHINTPFSADLTYFMMKPLEWLFLVLLYLLDMNPENRIAMQYTGMKA